jgi:hypothetical protein
LVEQSGATNENIRSIETSLQSLQLQVDGNNSLRFILSPLVIKNRLVVIDRNLLRLNDLLSSSPVSRTINEKINYDCLAASDNYITVVLSDQLCLFDQNLIIQQTIPWNHDYPWDMVWSKTLGQFILITAEEIYTFNEQTMTIGQDPIIHNNNKSNWWCGTCSDDTLFISAMGQGASIFEYILQPMIKLVKEYHSPISCAHDEVIDDLSSNNHTLAIIIRTSQKNFRLDLCSIKTLERFQSIQLGFSHEYRRARCCSLINDHWLVINSNDELFQISEDGKFIEKERYNPIPRHAVSFGQRFLAIVAHGNICLHELNN